MDFLEIQATTFKESVKIEITPQRRELIGSLPMVRAILFDDDGKRIQHNNLLVEYEGDAELEPSNSTFVIVHTNKLQGKIILTKF